MRRPLHTLIRRWLASRRDPQARRRRERGMNLLEIMVVLVIISLVAGTVGVAVLNRLEDARKRQASVQLHNIAEALELYKLQFHSYPSTGEGLQALVAPKSGAQPFMQQLPKDPWDREYVYIYPGSNNQGGFDLLSYGADGVQGGGDDISNWSSGETAKD